MNQKRQHKGWFSSLFSRTYSRFELETILAALVFGCVLGVTGVVYETYRIIVMDTQGVYTHALIVDVQPVTVRYKHGALQQEYDTTLRFDGHVGLRRLKTRYHTGDTIRIRYLSNDHRRFFITDLEMPAGIFASFKDRFRNEDGDFLLFAGLIALAGGLGSRYTSRKLQERYWTPAPKARYANEI